MINRRQFLQSSAAWSAMTAMGQAGAQTATDYKALVCVFLYGGNDAFNTVLATDTDSWSAYTAVRNQQPSPIALMPPGTAANTSKSVGSPEWLGGVLPLSPAVAVSGRSFALHPKLNRLSALFNTDRRLAVVANVGPLVQPLTKAQYLAATRGGAGSVGIKLPAKLFSHNDQQNTWQAMSPEGATVGWGGQLADSFVAPGAAPGMYGAISVGGNAVWLSGQRVRQYQMGLSGAIAMGNAAGSTTVYGSANVANALKRIASNGLAGPGATGLARAGHVLMADLGTVAERSIKAEAIMSGALNTQSLTTTPFGPDTRTRYTNLAGNLSYNSLASQLQAVARVIAARSTLGAGRQVFFVSMSGFDNHDNQNYSHAELMARLDHALGYFDETLGLLGAQNMVTTFTASDFGRTFTSNGDGTDHGWGAHHFVMGGAVRGGRIVGSFPKLGIKNTNDNSFDSSDDQLGNGVLLPTTSVDQLGATLATWFGASNPGQIFTNLGRFGSQNLGFMA